MKRMLFPQAYLLLIALSSCAGGINSLGDVVPMSDRKVLREKYFGEISEREGEIGFTIDVDPKVLNPEDIVAVRTIVTNQSGGDIIIRRQDGRSIQYSTFEESPAEIVYNISPDDPSIQLNFPITQTLSPGPIVIPPEEFVKLKPNEDYSVTLQIPEFLEPLPPGHYSISLVYRNYMYGAYDPEGPEDTFLDLHAWLGEKRSNTASFEVTP